jgi:hypothetical protein
LVGFLRALLGLWSAPNLHKNSEPSRSPVSVWLLRLRMSRKRSGKVSKRPQPAHGVQAGTLELPTATDLEGSPEADPRVLLNSLLLVRQQHRRASRLRRHRVRRAPCRERLRSRTPLTTDSFRRRRLVKPDRDWVADRGAAWRPPAVGGATERRKSDRS